MPDKVNAKKSEDRFLMAQSFSEDRVTYSPLRASYRSAMKLLRLVLINVAVFISLLGFCFLVVEIWARTQPRNMFIEFDPVLGFRLKPDVEGIYRGLSVLHPNPEIHTKVQINSLGLRGPEVSIGKPPGVRRLLILGDSFVEAFEVPYEQTFYARLEKMAQAAGHFPLQVLSMGVMGYGTAQELLWLRQNGNLIKPDVVLLILFLGNDVVDNSRALHFSGARPYFDLVGNQLELVSLPNALNRYKYWAAEHIRSFLLYKELAVRFSGIRQLLDRFSLDNNPGRGSTAPRTQSDPRPYRGYQLTFALVKEMQRTTKKLGSHLLVAYYGDYQTGLPEDGSELTAAFCIREKVECLNLNPDVNPDPRNVVPNDGHWSVAGHRVVADSLWRQWGAYLTRPIPLHTGLRADEGTEASIKIPAAAPY